LTRNTRTPWVFGISGGVKCGNHAGCIQNNVITFGFHISQVDVFHIDDPIQLPNTVKELYNLVKSTGNCKFHGNFCVKRFWNLIHWIPRVEGNAGNTCHTLHGGQEGWVLRIFRQDLIEIALVLLFVGQQCQIIQISGFGIFSGCQIVT
jgi:hypothetical protein